MTIRDIDTYNQYRAHASAGDYWADVTDECYEAVWDVIKQKGLLANNTDCAENLVTEIFRYIWDSNH